jgi:hypothetical protein
MTVDGQRWLEFIRDSVEKLAPQKCACPARRTLVKDGIESFYLPYGLNKALRDKLRRQFAAELLEQ